MQLFKVYRRGFTLVELLMVIIILSIVTVATIPLVRPALDTRKIREAARMLSALITEAQTRAAETGRPVGIWIERIKTGAGATAVVEPGAAMNVYLCETPPPYSGDTLNSRAIVRVGGPPAYATVQLFPDTGWYRLLRPNDLIRFNHSGATYSFTGKMEDPITPGQFIDALEEYPVGSGSYIIKFDMPPLPPQKFQLVPTNSSDPTFRFPPAAGTPGGWQVPYQIIRQPVKMATTPLQLPNGTVIDLFHSGVGTSYFGTAVNGSGVKFTKDRGPMGFTFSPSGALEKLHFIGMTQQLTQPVYLLVGKRERIATDTSSTSTYPPTFDPQYASADPRETQTEKHNFRDLENLWVCVNPQTGLVTTAEMHEFVDTDPSIVSPIELIQRQNAVNASRQSATSAQTMGGR
jgi:prepilin-type N-terminal cleavage/methylation domain-containing protein